MYVNSSFFLLTSPPPPPAASRLQGTLCYLKNHKKISLTQIKCQKCLNCLYFISVVSLGAFGSLIQNLIQIRDKSKETKLGIGRLVFAGKLCGCSHPVSYKQLVFVPIDNFFNCNISVLTITFVLHGHQITKRQNWLFWKAILKHVWLSRLKDWCLKTIFVQSC